MHATGVRIWNQLFEPSRFGRRSWFIIGKFFLFHFSLYVYLYICLDNLFFLVIFGRIIMELCWITYFPIDRKLIDTRFNCQSIGFVMARFVWRWRQHTTIIFYYNNNNKCNFLFFSQSLYVYFSDSFSLPSLLFFLVESGNREGREQVDYNLMWSRNMWWCVDVIIIDS